MDPQVAWELAKDFLTENDQIAALATLEDLEGWMSNGGFSPYLDPSNILEGPVPIELVRGHIWVLKENRRRRRAEMQAATAKTKMRQKYQK